MFTHTSGRFLLLGILVGVLVGTVVFVVHFPGGPFGTGLLWRLELLSYDWRLPTRDAFVNDIVIVAIDQESSVSIQAWPWPRSFHARLLDRLTAAGARVIGLHVVFSTLSSCEVPQSWLREPPPSADDLAFARAIKRSGRVVLAALLQEAGSPRGEMSSAVVAAEFPHWRFEEGAAGVGIVNFPRDLDGTVRRMYLQHQCQGRTETSFATTVLQVADGLGRKRGAVRLLPSHPYLPRHTLPISYAGPAQTYRTVPFYQALDPDWVPDETFRDKIVLVGATDALLQDIHLSPVAGPIGREMPGVEIQANSIATLLSGEHIRPVPL